MRRSIFYITFLCLFLTSCSHDSQYMKALAEVDSLTKTDADSARLILKGMNEKMNGASDDVKAYYHLLQVKADDRALVRLTSDSLICSVADYYEKTGNHERLPETYYYVGRANVDMKNTEKALFYMQKVLVQDSTYLTPHLRGCACAQIGYVYLRNALFDEAKTMQGIAYCYFKEDGDTVFMRYCREDMRTIDTIREMAVVDSVAVSRTKLMIMRVNEKLHSRILLDKNSDLQHDYAQNERKHKILDICIIACVIIGLGLAVFFVKRKKLQKTEVPDSDTEDAQQPTMTKRLFYDKEISEMISLHIKQNKVLKPSDWALIEERLLEKFPDFRDKLYSLYNLSETEYHICLLVKLEVQPSGMAKLMATSNSSISQSRLRMQQKVFNGVGTAKDWDNYVQLLS